MRNFEQKQILSLLTKILVDYFRKYLDNPMIPETTLDLFRIYIAIQISNYIFVLTKTKCPQRLDVDSIKVEKCF